MFGGTPVGVGYNEKTGEKEGPDSLSFSSIYVKEGVIRVEGGVGRLGRVM